MPQKILVVDDEPDAVELIQFNLKGAGFDVVTAALYAKHTHTHTHTHTLSHTHYSTPLYTHVHRCR